jgi:hypothetical protein
MFRALVRILSVLSLLVVSASPALAGPVRLERSKATVQSSVSGNDPQFGSDRANDGLASDNSVAKTEREVNPWWEIDLGGEAAIENITVLAPVSFGTTWLRTFQVLLSSDGLNYQLIYTHDGTAFRNRAVPAGGLSARYVRIRLQETQRLALQEVWIFKEGSIAKGPRPVSWKRITIPGARHPGSSAAAASGTATGGSGPILWYKFSEKTGVSAKDASGNDKNGTLVNAPTWTPGKTDNAVHLDGANDYVSLPTGVVSQLNDFTVAAWVKLDSSGAWRRIFDFGSSTTVNMFLVPSSGSTIRFAITTGGNGQEQQINGTQELPVGSWKHVAVTLSGKTGTLYVDGVAVGQNTNMTLKPSSLGATVNNWIGRSQYAADGYLQGAVDDFRIYGRALSKAELQALAASGPMVWYKFSEKTGVSAKDASGNDKTGALVNAPTWTPGKTDNAVHLDGANDYVSLPTGVVSQLNDFTVAAWVKLDSNGAWRRIFDFGSSTTVNMFLVPSSGSTIRFAITTGGNGQEQQINGTQELPVGSWKHVAVTLSGKTGTLYVDGVAVGQNTNMTLKPSSLGATVNNWIGRSQYAADGYLNGAVDDFRIYGRALSKAELQVLTATR